MGRNRCEYDRDFGRYGVAIFEEEGQGGAAQSQHQVRWCLRVLVAQELRRPLFVFGIEDARKVEKIGIKLDLLRGSLEQTLACSIGDYGGGGEGKVKCVKHKNAARRFGRAGRWHKPLDRESQGKDPAASGRTLSH